MRAPSALMLAVTLLLGARHSAWPHCEIPCGIYHDDLRFSLIEEDVTTIEKAVRQIDSLGVAGTTSLDQNQLVRWISTKDTHAERIRETVVAYFLVQRISAPEESDQQAYSAYTNQLVLVHKILKAAMKCKQSVDLPTVEVLRAAAHDLQHAYRAAHPQ